ncbi:MAG: hypothetical protein ACTSU5_02290 [Promethearchaeota archaeon]
MNPTDPTAPVVLEPRVLKQIVLFGSRFANNELDPPRWAEVYAFLLGHLDPPPGTAGAPGGVRVTSIVPLVHGTKNKYSFSAEDYALAEDAVERAAETGAFACGAVHSLPGKPLELSRTDRFNLAGFPHPAAVMLLFDPVKISGDDLGMRAFRLLVPGDPEAGEVEVPVEVGEVDPVFLAKTLVEVSDDAAFQRPLMPEYREVLSLADDSLRDKYLAGFFPEFAPAGEVGWETVEPRGDFAAAGVEPGLEPDRFFVAREEAPPGGDVPGPAADFQGGSWNPGSTPATAGELDLEPRLEVMRDEVSAKVAAGFPAGEEYMALGRELESAGRREEALRAYSRAAEEFLSSGEGSEYLESVDNVAQLYLEMNFVDQAIEVLEDARESHLSGALRGDLRGLRATVALLNTLGVAYQRTRELGKAYGVLNEALQLGKAAGDQESLFGTAVNLGGLFVDLHEYRTAISLLVKAVVFFRFQGDFYGEMAATANLGRAYLEVSPDYWPIARKLLLSVVESGDDVPPDVKLEAFESLARGERDHGSPETSLDLAFQALQLARDSGEERAEMRVHSFIGELYETRFRDGENAATYYGYALEIAREAFDDLAAQADLLFRLSGVHYALLGNLGRALELLVQARASAERRGDLGTLARILAREGFVLEKMGDISGAMAAFEEAASTYARLEDAYNRDQMQLQVERLRTL